MSEDACIRITGPATEGYSVPAEVVVRVLEGLQQSIWILAAAADSKAVRQRFKPNQSFKQRFTLRIAVPERSSFAIPLMLTDERPQIAWIATETPADPMGALFTVWKELAAENLQGIRSLVGDEGLFVRLMQAFRSILPKREDRWGIGFGKRTADEVELSARHRPVIEAWLESSAEQRETSVIGELQRIDFAEKRIWIAYPPTRRLIECSYLDEVEDTIIDARRALFQVTGQFVLDNEGHPLRLTGVRSIEAVDLSPVRFDEVEVADGRFLLDPPIVLTPELDADVQQYFVAEVDEFGLSLGGRTRDTLLQDFAEQLNFIWCEYAMADEHELTEDALELRRRLLERVKRVEAE